MLKRGASDETIKLKKCIRSTKKPKCDEKVESNSSNEIVYLGSLNNKSKIRKQQTTQRLSKMGLKEKEPRSEFYRSQNIEESHAVLQDLCSLGNQNKTSGNALGTVNCSNPIFTLNKPLIPKTTKVKLPSYLRSDGNDLQMKILEKMFNDNFSKTEKQFLN